MKARVHREEMTAYEVYHQDSSVDLVYHCSVWYFLWCKLIHYLYFKTQTKLHDGISIMSNASPCPSPLNREEAIKVGKKNYGSERSLP